MFFLYTLFGSVLMLLGIIYIYVQVGSTDYETLLNYNFNSLEQRLVIAFIWARAALPRYRYDQLMSLGWKAFLPLSLGWLLFTVACLISFNWLPE